MSGYGYCRPHIQMFDPGWRGKQQLLSEDVTTDAVDLGGDPQGVIDRQAHTEIGNSG